MKVSIKGILIGILSLIEWIVIEILDRIGIDLDIDFDRINHWCASHWKAIMMLIFLIALISSKLDYRAVCPLLGIVIVFVSLIGMETYLSRINHLRAVVKKMGKPFGAKEGIWAKLDLNFFAAKDPEEYASELKEFIDSPEADSLVAERLRLMTDPVLNEDFQEREQKLPSLTELHEIAEQTEMDHIRINNIFFSSLLITGIFGTLYGVHGFGSNDSGSIEGLKPALLPSACAVGCMVVLMVLRSIHQMTLDRLLGLLDHYTVDTLITCLQPSTEQEGKLEEYALPFEKLNSCLTSLRGSIYTMNSFATGIKNETAETASTMDEILPKLCSSQNHSLDELEGLINKMRSLGVQKLSLADDSLNHLDQCSSACSQITSQLRDIKETLDDLLELVKKADDQMKSGIQLVNNLSQPSQRYCADLVKQLEAMHDHLQQTNVMIENSLKLKEQQIKENKKVTGLSKKEYIVLALIAISLIIKLIITK